MLNYEFPILGGGAGNAAFYTLKEFSKYKKLQIDLITTSIDNYKEQKFSPNIHIYYLNIGKKGENLNYQSLKDLSIYSLKAFFKAKELLKKNNYDLIHAFFGVPCGLIAMLLGKPYLVSLRGSDVPFFNPRFYWPDKLIFQYLSRKIWGRARFVIANSQGLKKMALKISPKQKINIVYNGVDNNFYKPFKHIKKENLILFVGRLIQRKGAEYLIEAFGQIAQDFPNYRLWLVGDGPDKSKLIKLGKKYHFGDKIKFIKVKNKKELVKIYNKAKIYILPSLNEGMANTVLEAMACGLPIIQTDTGGSEELVKKNGIIIKKKNPEEIVKALEICLKKEKLMLQMGRESRKIAQFFSWKKSAQAYLNFYQSLK